MDNEDLIKERQYAETVFKALNIRPYKIDLLDGRLMVPTEKVKVARKICKSFNWPLTVGRLK